MRTIPETLDLLSSTYLWDGAKAYYRINETGSVAFGHLDLSDVGTGAALVRTMRELCGTGMPESDRCPHEDAMVEAVARELGQAWIVDSPDYLLSERDEMSAGAFCAKTQEYYRTLRDLADDEAFDRLTAGFVLDTLLANHALPDDVTDAELRLWTSGKVA